MPLTREERKLLHQKSKQPTFGSGKPDNKQGNEGDISFRQVQGSGTVEYVKTNGEWVAVASSGEMPAVRIIGSSGGGGTSGTGTFSGSYVATITGGDGIDSTGSTSGSNINHTLSLDLSELTGAAMTTSDSIAFIDADDSNNSKKESIADVVTLLAGDGIKNSSNVFAVDVSDFAGTGLEDDSSENLRLSTQGTGISGGNGSTLSITPAQTAITSVYNTSLVIGRAADDTTINFGVDDVIVFDSGADEKLRIDSGGADVTGALTTTTTAAIGTNATFGTSTAAGNMNALLSSAQDTFFGNLLDGSDDIFDFGGANGDGGTTLIDSDGFTASNATFVRVIGPNYGHLENTSSAQGYVSLPLTTVSGKVYECTFDVIAGGSSDIEVCLSSSTSWNTAAESGIRSANTGHSLVHNYIADDTSGYLIIRLASSTSGHAGRITNIVVRQAVFFSDGEISSGSYVSGFAGSGWKIDKDATATNEYDLTVDNMFIRGRLSVYELLIQQIRATNGAIFVTSSAKVLSTSSLSASDSGGDITFEDPSGHGICPFLANDLIMMQRVVPGSLVAGSSTAGSTNVIKKLVYKVSSVSGATATVIAATGFNNNDFPVKGDDFVRIGNTGTPSRQGTIYLTSDDSNAPYMDVKDNIDSYGDWHDASTTKVRVGNLSGITDAGLNAGSSLSGYGLYGGEVFLKGAINAKSGHIGADNSGANGWKIEESKLANTPANDAYLSLDGTGDYLSLGQTTSDSPMSVTDDITICGWIRFPSLGSTETIFINNSQDANYAGFWVYKDSSNRMAILWGDGSEIDSNDYERVYTSSSAFSSNTWTFISIRTNFTASSTSTGNHSLRVGTGTTLGSSLALTAAGSGENNSASYGTGEAYIGAETISTDDVDNRLDMKNFALWNEILTDAEITALFNGGSYLSFGTNSGGYTSAANLKLHLDFTTGSINDLTGNTGTSLVGDAKIVGDGKYIGLVQSANSSLSNSMSGFYAGGDAATGANAAISFGTDGKIRGNGIYVKNNIDYLITASRIFGNGSDGVAYLSGTSNTLSSDKYYTILTLAASTTIETRGYRIFVRDKLILIGSGIKIYNNGFVGNAGGDASDDGGVTATSNDGANFSDGNGAGARSGSLLGGIVGGDGGNGGNGGVHGGSSATNGIQGDLVSATTNCVRAYTTNDGVAGGSGGGSTVGSSATRSGVASTDGSISITNSDLTYIIAMKDFFTTSTSIPSLSPAAGAIGGGGGGGGGTAGAGTTGGGGGSGGCAGGSGGHVMLVAKEIIGTLSHLELEAKGGAGGAGGDGYEPSGGSAGGDGGAGAGGNGGDGGCITLITGTDPSDIVIDVGGGAAGANGSGSTASIGTPLAGKEGTKIIYHV
tara:strand:- start:15346 stop:19446 length:4101 start_codon:yes stop_codon:yes gene_type:complete